MGALPQYSRKWITDGAIGGLLAGVTLAIAQMGIAVALGLPALSPVRLISSVALGPAALSPAFPLALITLGFIVVHFSISAIYGTVFSLLLTSRGWLTASSGLILLLGFAYAVAISLVNLLLVPFVAWSQFTVIDLVWEGAAPHAFFFGGPLAVYVLWARSRMSEG